MNFGDYDGRDLRDAAHNRLPKDLKRVDPPHTPDGQSHIHTQKGAAINKDGTLHDKHKGAPQLSKKTIEYLRERRVNYNPE